MVLCFLGVLYGNVKSSMCIFVVFAIDLLQLFVILIFLYQNYDNDFISSVSKINHINNIWLIWLTYLLIAVGIPGFILSTTIISVFTEELKQEYVDNDRNCLFKVLAIICIFIISLISIIVLFIMTAIFSCGLSYIWIWIIIMAIDAPMYEIHPRGQFSQWITENINKSKDITQIYKLCCINSMIINTLDSTIQNTKATDSAKDYLLEHSMDPTFKHVKLKRFVKSYPDLSVIKRLDKEVLNSLLIGKNVHKILYYLQKYSLFWYMIMRIPQMLAPFLIIFYMTYEYKEWISLSQKSLLLLVFLSLDIIFIIIALCLFGSMSTRLYYGWHIIYAKDTVYKQVKKDLYSYLLLLYSKRLIGNIINEEGIADIITDFVGIHDLNLN